MLFLPRMLSLPVASPESVPLPRHKMWICWLECATDKSAAMAGGSIHGDISPTATKVLPWCCSMAGDADGDQEEPGQALPADAGRDMVAHSAIHHSTSGMGKEPGALRWLSVPPHLSTARMGKEPGAPL